MKEEITYKSSDCITNIHAIIWRPTTEVKAIVQISHGMVEHIERYSLFANSLNKRGILVCGNDHLGHGYSVTSKKNYVYFSKKYYNKILVYEIY